MYISRMVHCNARSRDDLKSPEYRSFNITAPQATVFAAALALLGGAAGAGITGWFTQGTNISVETTKVTGQLDLERLKFQTSLILKAIDTPDREVAITTLQFFANAGLIPAYDKKVLDLTTIDNGRGIPTTSLRYRQISELSDPRLIEFARAVGKLAFTGTASFVCTAFLIKGNITITIGHCKPQQSAEGTFILGESDPRGPKAYKVKNELPVNENSRIRAFTIGGDPVSVFGSIEIRTREPKVGESIALIHYPLGGASRVSMDGCFVMSIDQSKEYGLRYYCNTQPGSGGAPILALSDFNILGIHASRVIGESNFEAQNIKDGVLMYLAAMHEKLLNSDRSR